MLVDEQPAPGIAHWVARWAALQPGRPAVVFGDRTLTWAQLDAGVNRTARVLLAHGVAPGDRVAVYLRNRPEFLEVFFAVARLGAIAVLVNHFLTRDEVSWLVGDAGARLVVAEADFDPVDGARWVTVPELTEQAATESGATVPELVAPDGVAALLYTSGTTGFPKGAMTTHDAIRFSTLQWIIHIGLRPGDHHLVTVPLSFTGGCMAGVMPAVHSGGTIVLEPAFAPGRALELIERHRIAWTMGVATMCRAMAEHELFDSVDLGSLRGFFVGGGPVPAGLLRRWQERGVPFVQSFSITEGNSLCLALPPEDAVRKRGSCGLPLLYCDADVRDESGNSCAPDEVGELVLRGPVVFAGYWNNDEATARILVDGWLHTGDVARRDRDGYYTIVDRKHDLIISGGLNVYPAEVEAVLLDTPGVAEAAVIGLPDEKWGELVTAVLVAAPGADPDPSLVSTVCAGRLAAYKVPKRVEFVERLPRTLSGKLQRRLVPGLLGEDCS